MEIPAQIFLYLFIILIYFLVKKRKKLTTKEIFKLLGFSFSLPKSYLYSIGISLFSILIAILLLTIFPLNLSLLENTTFSHYKEFDLTILSLSLIFLRELIFIALGEELFFRGLIGGVLFRNFSFFKANIFQTLIFLLPHLFLLFISIQLLPFLIIIIISGWLLGWLRYKSDSIFPCILAHSLTNTIAIILMLNYK